jgi:hypothetical protein
MGSKLSLTYLQDSVVGFYHGPAEFNLNFLQFNSNTIVLCAPRPDVDFWPKSLLHRPVFDERFLSLPSRPVFYKNNIFYEKILINSGVNVPNFITQYLISRYGTLKKRFWQSLNYSSNHRPLTEVHYPNHKSPLLLYTLSQWNPLQNLKPQFLSSILILPTNICLQ